MSNKSAIAVKRQTFQIKVDGSENIFHLIKSGKYDIVRRSDMTSENFPIKDKTERKVSIELFNFDIPGLISPNEVIKKMKEEGYRPVTIEEFLSIGIHKPKLQKKFPLICVGAPWRDPYDFHKRLKFVILGLGHGETGREIELDHCGKGWSYWCRFPAVRISL